MVLRTLLFTKGRRKEDEEKNISLTQAGGIRELSIYKENSQLISDTLWEQVIHYFKTKQSKN